MIHNTHIQQFKNLKKAYQQQWFFLKWFFPRSLAKALTELNEDKPSKGEMINVIKAFINQIWWFQFFLFPFLITFEYTKLMSVISNKACNDKQLSIMLVCDEPEKMFDFFSVQTVFNEEYKQQNLDALEKLDGEHLNFILHLYHSIFKNSLLLEQPCFDSLTKLNLMQIPGMDEQILKQLFSSYNYFRFLSPLMFDFFIQQPRDTSVAQIKAWATQAKDLYDPIKFIFYHMIAVHNQVEYIPDYNSHIPLTPSHVLLIERLKALGLLNSNRCSDVFNIFDLEEDHKKLITLFDLSSHGIEISERACQILIDYTKLFFYKRPPIFTSDIKITSQEDFDKFINCIERNNLEIQGQRNAREEQRKDSTHSVHNLGLFSAENHTVAENSDAYQPSFKN